MVCDRAKEKVLGLRVNGEKIHRLRERAVMSRQDLMREAGVSYSTVANLETGFKEKAHPETIRKLAHGLGVCPAELLMLETTEESKVGAA